MRSYTEIDRGRMGWECGLNSPSRAAGSVNSNEPSGFVECWELLEWLLNKDFALWS
jgi:hypothetical protein